MDFKPIETKYKGYRFRSRLEARWAVFFDKMGIRYEYEKEGFEMTIYEGTKAERKIRYLPDFYFPDYDIYGEVKGCNTIGAIPKKDMEKMTWMVDDDGPCAKGIIILGDIPNPQNVSRMCWLVFYCSNGFFTWDYIDGDISYCTKPWEDPLWGSCEHIHAPFTFFPEDCDLVLTNTMSLWDMDGAYCCVDHELTNALKSARSARFEWGEHG